MEGKTCLITGGSDGIGYSAARELARMGARVVIVGRNAAKTDAAVQRIIAETGNPAVERLLADLSSQREVRRVAAEALERLPRLDVLLNNAGAIFLSNRRSVDGIEMTFALNHIGYFMLTNLLMDRLRESAPARVINVSSSSHGSPGRFRLEDLPKPAAIGATGPTVVPSSATSCSPTSWRGGWKARASPSTHCTLDWCRPTSPAIMGCWAAPSTSSSALAAWMPTRERRRWSTWRHRPKCRKSLASLRGLPGRAVL